MVGMSRRDRMRLVKYVCSFAWADGVVQPEERGYVRQLVWALSLDGEEREEVEAWLESPPREEEVDPRLVPVEHRQLFLDSVRTVIRADGKLAATEKVALRVFEKLLPKGSGAGD
jgi:hypothetical protein